MIGKNRPFFASVAATLLLVACGGSSGDGGGQAGIDGTGAPKTIAAFGSISAFGSVVVNGVRYDTAAAQFTVEDNPGSQSDLAIGDVVLVRGTLDSNGLTGTATSVTFDDQVEGPIAAINGAAGTFVVLGQTLRVGADTSFDDRIQPASLSGLAVGMVVEVSGLPESDGSVRATRIEPKPAGLPLELTGVVAGHDAVTRRFNVNAQVVDYSAVGQLRDFPGGVVANGQTVEIKGGTLVNGVWSPSSVEWQGNSLTGAAGERREVEGFISRFASAADFTVAGLAVTTNAQTAFTGGVAADLGLDVKVEVEGALNGAGVLVATKVDIRRSSAVRIVAVVDRVDAAGGSFTVLGITIRMDALTRIEDKSSQQMSPFALANMSAGDYVEVRGVELPPGSGEVLAALVERDNVEPDAELQGFVQAVQQPNFTILGVTIGTTAGTKFHDLNGNEIESTQFFAQLAAGDLASAEARVVGVRALQATEAELEN